MEAASLEALAAALEGDILDEIADDVELFGVLEKASRVTDETRAAVDKLILPNGETVSTPNAV